MPPSVTWLIERWLTVKDKTEPARLRDRLDGIAEGRCRPLPGFLAQDKPCGCAGAGHRIARYNASWGSDPIGRRISDHDVGLPKIPRRGC